jgi:hypothetical protein
MLAADFEHHETTLVERCRHRPFFVRRHEKTDAVNPVGFLLVHCAIENVPIGDQLFQGTLVLLIATPDGLISEHKARGGQMSAELACKLAAAANDKSV